MSYVLYDLSAKKTAAAVIMILVPVFVALAIVYTGIIDDKVLSYFSDALDLAVLGIVIVSSILLGVKVKKLK